MRKVTCSMGVSLDGYIAGPDGGDAWSSPDEEVFRFATQEVRGLGVHLPGRRLYETMSSWETVDQASLSDLEREFAALWTSLPKVVFLHDPDLRRGRLPHGGRWAGRGGREVARHAGAGPRRHRRRHTRCRGVLARSGRRVPAPHPPCARWRRTCSSHVPNGARTWASSTAARSSQVLDTSATAWSRAESLGVV